MYCRIVVDVNVNTDCLFLFCVFISICALSLCELCSFCLSLDWVLFLCFVFVVFRAFNSIIVTSFPLNLSKQTLLRTFGPVLNLFDSNFFSGISTFSLCLCQAINVVLGV